MQIEKYNRKTFQVEAVRIVLDDIEEIAAWCGGTIEKRPHKMMGSEALLPVINLKGTGVEHANYYIGYLNYWVVKMGKTPRIYTPEQFSRTFTKFLQPTIQDVLQLITDSGFELYGHILPAGTISAGLEESLSPEVNRAIEQALQIAAAEVDSHNTECEV